MKNFYLVVLLLAGFAAVAYAQTEKSKPAEKERAQNRYQIVAATDGGAWRIDTATGVVHHCRLFGAAPVCLKEQPETTTR